MGDYIIILSQFDFRPWNINEMNKMWKKFNKRIYYRSDHIIWILRLDFELPCSILDFWNAKNLHHNPYHMIMDSLYLLKGWKSFNVYYTRQKGPSLYYNPFLPYILIPIKNNESKVIKIFRRTIL
jgi:hypothetical protein